MVNEEALIIALKTRQITGAATDIFLYKPTGPENSVLLDAEPKDLNLVVTPYSTCPSSRDARNDQISQLLLSVCSAEKQGYHIHISLFCWQYLGIDLILYSCG